MSERDSNPWLSIPASDYEGHMGGPAVQQLQYLSTVFGEILLRFRPEALAVLGCATGNGFDRIPPATKRIIGIDVNPDYLELLRARYGSRLPGLELTCGDIVACAMAAASVDLVHAALVLEYLEPEPVVARVARWLKPGGVFSVVLQLPSAARSPVTDTAYASLKLLERFMKLVSPGAMESLAAAHNFGKLESRVDTLPTGKEFYLGMFVSGAA